MFQENIIDDLVLKNEAKNLIEALSNPQASGPEENTTHDNGGGFVHWSADIIKNKGEGRIFLLHGKPGVGTSLYSTFRDILLGGSKWREEGESSSESPKELTMQIYSVLCLPCPLLTPFRENQHC